MKKDYLKPTARSHELRCRSMVAQSPLEEGKLRFVRPSSSSDPDSDYDSADPPMWAD